MKQDILHCTTFDFSSFYQLLVFVFITVCWMVSSSLLTLVAVLVFLRICLMVGLLTFSIATVTFVLGEPILEMLAPEVVCWEAIQASPIARPEDIRTNILFCFIKNINLEQSEWRG